MQRQQVLLLFCSLLSILSTVIIAGKCDIISTDDSLASNSNIGQDVELSFYNKGSAKLDIYWVDSLKNEVYMDVLDASNELG